MDKIPFFERERNRIIEILPCFCALSVLSVICVNGPKNLLNQQMTMSSPSTNPYP